MANIGRMVRSVRAFSRDSRELREIEFPQHRRTLGLALGRGFARGMVHVGALKVLEEENIPVDFVAGTSVGAIIGASYCSGMTAAN